MSTAAPDLLLINIKQLVQVRQSTPEFVSGAEMSNLPVLSNAWLHLSDGKLAGFGTMESIPAALSTVETLDVTGRMVFPSYVDSHTHLVFAAGREEEFVMKIKGKSYEEIAASGGGILNSARRLRAMSEDELFERSLKRIHEIISSGTGAVEIKSGYGLTVEDELKMLRVARKLGRETRMIVKTSLLGAHAVPQGFNKSDYVKMVIDEMIPAAAAEKLADYTDSFCEEGFFNEEETIAIAEAGKKFGLAPRIHANQLHRSGGVQAGVKTNAKSVDHLENIGAEEIALLRGTSVMPTALPGAAFFLNLPFPPARQMIDQGLPLAIASDYNPGSAPSGNMAFMVSLACIKMKLTPEEAFNACTINTAYAIDLLDSHGSITIGKAANIYITEPLSSIAFIPYSMGNTRIDFVVLKGHLQRIDSSAR